MGLLLRKDFTIHAYSVCVCACGARRLLRAGCCVFRVILRGACCMLCVVCCGSRVACCVLSVAFYMSRVECCASHIQCREMRCVVVCVRCL